MSLFNFINFIYRYKSPTFRDNETQLLLKLIEKYKYPLLIKSTLFSVTHTKDKAWAELTKEFNSLNTGYNYERTTDVLKTKWDNLKRLARRSSKNAIEPGDQLFHNEIVKTVITICEADVGPMLESDNYEETGKTFSNNFSPLVNIGFSF